MAELFGNTLSRRQIMSRIGDISQLSRITDYRFQSGRAENMRAYEVKNGTGLSFTVLPSRGMDIAWADYKGIPISFISKSGTGAPGYFEKDGLGFLRNFTCGLLTTCGLTYMGAPCVDQGQDLGLHGRISNIAAEDCCSQAEWIGDDYVLNITGKVREASIFGENLVLERTISTKLGGSQIQIRDKVTNEGYEDTPFMLLYHCNFGYPLIGPQTTLTVNHRGVRSRDARAEEGIAVWNQLHEPVHGFTEQLYYFDMTEDREGYAEAVIENPSLSGHGLRVRLRYKKEGLPYCSEWKQLGEGDYVLGIEPATWLPEGRAKARERGELKMLASGESHETELNFIVEEL